MNTLRALQTLETLKSLIDSLRIAKERLSSGVLTEKELCDSLLDTILYDVELDNIPDTEKYKQLVVLELDQTKAWMLCQFFSDTIKSIFKLEDEVENSTYDKKYKQEIIEIEEILYQQRGAIE